VIGVAVCGAGTWGQNLVRTFDTRPGARLLYVCDVSEAVRERMSRLYPDATVTGEMQALLEDSAVEAVVVGADAPHHHRLARAAIDAGKHTFVEKPLTLRSEDAEDLIQAAQKRGVKLMVGHLLKFHPAVDFMKRMIREGSIDPLYAYFQRVNLGKIRQAENAWWSLAPHDVSIACHLFDADPVEITATGQSYLQSGIEDVVFANLRFADGRMAHIHVSWLDPHKMRKMTIVGSKKMVVFDDMETTEKVRVYDKGADVKSGVESYVESIMVRVGDIWIPKIPSGEPLALECEHFLAAISNDTEPLSDGHDGLRVVRILEAGTASLAQGGVPVAIGPGPGEQPVRAEARH
jgi:predicted dehydrogenase